MLLPHIARHPAKYLGTTVLESGATLAFGRLAGPGPCTLWLDEGGIHFERGEEYGTMLLPRRCLVRAETRRQGLGLVVEVTWHGANNEPWITRFTARRGETWSEAVQALKAATEQWSCEARAGMAAPGGGSDATRD